MTPRRRRNPHPRLTANRALDLLRDLDVVRAKADGDVYRVLRQTADALVQHVRSELFRGRRK